MTTAAAPPATTNIKPPSERLQVPDDLVTVDIPREATIEWAESYVGLDPLYMNRLLNVFRHAGVLARGTYEAGGYGCPVFTAKLESCGLFIEFTRAWDDWSWNYIAEHGLTTGHQADLVRLV